MRALREKVGKAERHEEIRRILRAHRVSTQQELAQRLGTAGIDITQATLSRDLAELGVLRVSRPEGAVYEVEPVAAQANPQLVELGETILSLRENGFLVVVRTRPGVASAVALAIDNARLPECIGTLAGDDTIFATPARAVPTRRLAQRIQQLFSRENHK
jgi:transcriptional regulator of arginine metabolism